MASSAVPKETVMDMVHDEALPTPEVGIIWHGKAIIGNLELKNALYVSSFTLSLVSVSKLALQGISVTFNANHCNVYNTKTKETIANSVSRNGLYYIDGSQPLFAAIAKTPRL